MSAAVSGPLNAQEKIERLDSAVVSASRAGKSTPVTYTMIGKEELERVNPARSLPMLLENQPSVVTTNEGGTGLGYSKMTVRGAKGSQINVTLNGITLNDAESQEVFWVNIPALSSIIQSVQLQRGLGTTANGAGAFGASINMSTAFVGDRPFASMDVARGSFGTMMTTVSAGTGMLPSGLYASAAYSRDYTDGYIRNAKARVQSAFAVLGYMKGDRSLRLTWLMGDQHTGITWEGLDMARYQAGDYRYNPAGKYKDAYGNTHYYDNETDNYTQHHLQLNYTQRLSTELTWSTTANFTKGDGYYEQYKSGKKFSAYGLSSEKAKSGDFIIHKSMDNSYFVLNSDLRYRTAELDVTGGVNLSGYWGGHFGNVLWSNVLGDDYDYSDTEWYRNDGFKREANVFSRAEYRVREGMTAYADLQYRGVFLDMDGKDDGFEPVDYRARWHFFNPRAGLTWDFAPGQRAYASIALGNREPGRSDLKENIKSANQLRELGDADAAVTLRPERMVDVEGGYRFVSRTLTATANLYLMEYRNMLLETGKLSPAGYAVKENVPRSWRRGIELSAAWRPWSVVRVDGNLTLSTNKIKDYTGYYEMYDHDYVSDEDPGWKFLGEYSEHYGKTTMLLSPGIVASADATFTPFLNMCDNSLKTTTFVLGGKFVGRQYWDNTQSLDRSIPAYLTFHFSASHTFSLPQGTVTVAAYLDNLLNNRYFADAWVYRARFSETASWYQEEGVFPQAPTSLLLKVSYRF